MPKIYPFNNPCKRGFKKFSLTKKQHKTVFGTDIEADKKNYEYYISDEGLEVYGFVTWQAKVLYLLTFPFQFIWVGLMNSEPLFAKFHSLFYEKKSGEFFKECYGVDKIPYIFSKKYYDIRYGDFNWNDMHSLLDDLNQKKQ